MRLSEEQMEVRQHCCERMVERLKFDCLQHDDVFECPERVRRLANPFRVVLF